MVYTWIFRKVDISSLQLNIELNGPSATSSVLICLKGAFLFIWCPELKSNPIYWCMLSPAAILYALSFPKLWMNLCCWDESVFIFNVILCYNERTDDNCSVPRRNKPPRTEKTMLCINCMAVLRTRKHGFSVCNVGFTPPTNNIGT